MGEEPAATTLPTKVQTDFAALSPTGKVEALRNETGNDAFFVGVYQTGIPC